MERFITVRTGPGLRRRSVIVTTALLWACGGPTHRVREVTSGPLLIFDRVYFAARSSDVPPSSLPVVDAVARTMGDGRWSIERIAIVGRAARDEGLGDPLALERANAVRDALVQRGVPRDRLETWTLGSRSPLERDELDRSVQFVLRRMSGADTDAPLLARARQAR